MSNTRSLAKSRRDNLEIVFSDIPLSFDRNPTTGELSQVTNLEAIKQSFKNIMLTMLGEWPRHQDIGSQIYEDLFEPLDTVTASVLETKVRNAAQKETRVSIIKVVVDVNIDNNGYDVSIEYITNLSTEVQVFTYFLKRVR